MCVKIWIPAPSYLETSMYVNQFFLMGYMFAGKI